MEKLSDDRMLRLLQLRKARHEAEEARLKVVRMQMEFRPSFYAMPIIRREAGHWVCLLEMDEDLLNCPVAYGESPHQAMLNFDALWLGRGLILPHPDETDDDTELEEM